MPETHAVPPPAANEIDALIEDVTAGRRSPASQDAAARADLDAPVVDSIPRPTLSAGLSRRVVTRWIAPSAVAFIVGAALTVWGLRVSGPPPAVGITGSAPSDATSAPTRSESPRAATEPTPSTLTAPASVTNTVPASPTTIPQPVTRGDRAAEPVVATVAPDALDMRIAAPGLRATVDEVTPAAPLPTAPMPVVVAATPATMAPQPESAEPANAATPVAASRAVAIVDEEASVRDVLNQYVAAFERMDVPAAAEVWPSVDRRALARAFDTLTSQGLNLENCELDIEATTAVARCDGSVEFTRKFGNAAPRVEQQLWLFKMHKRGPEWKIAELTASQAPSSSAARNR